MGDPGRSGGLTTPRGSSFSMHGSGGPGSGRHSSGRSGGGSNSSGSAGPSLAQLLSDPAVVAVRPHTIMHRHVVDMSSQLRSELICFGGRLCNMALCACMWLA